MPSDVPKSCVTLDPIAGDEQQQALCDLLRARRGASIEIVASDVTRVTTRGLQLLVSAAATYRADGHDLKIVNPSRIFADAVHSLGLTSQLSLAEHREP